MKTLLISIALVLTALVANGQNISGKWNGTLNLHGRMLSIVFKVKQSQNKLVATMDSPDQKVYDLTTSSTVFEQSKLSIKIDEAGIEYQGTLNENNQFVGVLIQSGEMFPLDLTNARISKTKKEITNIQNMAFSKFSLDARSLLTELPN